MVSQIASDHELAYNHELLHMNDNIDQFDIQKKFVIHAPNTDVLVLCLGHLHQINGDIYIKTGIKNRSRIISLEKVKEKTE